MKSISILSLLLILCSAITSCVEDEIGIYMHDNNGQYQMSAIINTADTVSIVDILKVQNYITVPVKDATIDIYVNGELSQTLDSCNYSKYESHYKFESISNFKAGDKVKFVAHIGDKTLTSETQCLQPIEIISVDTIANTIRLSDYEIDNTYRLHIKLRKPQGMSKNGNFFRLDIKHKITDVSYYDHKYDYEKQETYWVTGFFSYFDNKYTYKSDVALNNGNIDTGDEDLIQFVDQTANRYGVFTDDYFDGDTYTLVVDINRKLCWEDELYCIVSTITPEEYNYLRSVCSIVEDIEISDGAPVLKTNVTGGMGFMGIENAAVYTLKWANHFNSLKAMLDDSYTY